LILQPLNDFFYIVIKLNHLQGHFRLLLRSISLMTIIHFYLSSINQVTGKLFTYYFSQIKIKRHKRKCIKMLK
jgi:hypothetical protein